MKNFLRCFYIFSGIFFPGLSHAQHVIPNGSFENWSGPNQPVSWQVVQGKPTKGNLYSYTIITKSGDTLHLGRYAKNGVSFINMPMADSTKPCIISQKFAMNSRPRYFSMNYAYFPETVKNQFQVGFLFTRWNAGTNQEDTILSGNYNDSAGKLYQPWSTILKADLTGIYNPNTTLMPDTAMIIINSSIQSSPNLKTVLLIDEIYFTDTIVKASVKLPDNDDANSIRVSVYPNPFSDKTTIRYHLVQSGHVVLNISDMEGKKVARLIDEQEDAGAHEVTFNGKGLKDGIYFYQLQTENGRQKGKFILSK